MEMRNIMKRINALTAGRRAHCGKFGVVTCTKSAKDTTTHVRKFKTNDSQLLTNRGNWTLGALRKAIAAEYKA